MTEPRSSLSNKVAAGQSALHVHTRRPGSPSEGPESPAFAKDFTPEILILALSESVLVVGALKMVPKNQKRR